MTHTGLSHSPGLSRWEGGCDRGVEIKEVEGQGPGDEGSQDAKVVEDVDTLPHCEGFG